MDRVFLDANVLFSAAYKPQSPLRQLWELAGVELLTSTYAIEEATRNLAAARPERLPDLQQLVRALTVVPQPPLDARLPEHVCLKDKDQPILLAAVAAKATHLVTSDKSDFGQYYGQIVEGVCILSPREYLGLRAGSSKARPKSGSVDPVSGTGQEPPV